MNKLIICILFSISSFGILAQEKEWTVLVYLSADNNLSRYMEGILQRVEQIGASEQVNLLVQFDGDQHNDSKRLLIAKNHKEIIVSDLEYDMGDPATLADFVQWSVERYPSKKRALFVSAHGRGILNVAVADGSFQGGEAMSLAASPDDSSKSYMNEEAMVAALRPVLGDKKLDLFIYNSCLMGNFEVLQTLSSIAHYAIASEYIITIRVNDNFSGQEAAGVPFGEMLTALNSSPAIEALELGKRMLSAWRRSYDNFFSYYFGGEVIERYPATLALFDLEKVAEIESLLQSISEKIRASTDSTIYDRIFYQLVKTPTIQGDYYLDLLRLMQALWSATRIDEVEQLIYLLSGDEFIVGRELLNVDALAGVSIFFPNGKVIHGDQGLSSTIDFYSALNLVEKTGWDLLIRSYLRAIEDRKPILMVELVEAFLIAGELPQLSISTDVLYNEYYLFLMAEISFYPLLAISDYQLLIRYVSLITSVEYQSSIFIKHLKDMQLLIERQLYSEKDPEKREILTGLLRKFSR